MNYTQTWARETEKIHNGALALFTLGKKALREYIKNTPLAPNAKSFLMKLLKTGV